MGSGAPLTGFRVLVTGINGFVGRHVAHEFALAGAAVVGVGKDEEPAAGVAEDLSDYHSLDLVECWPSIADVDGVVHLAGLAAVGGSFANPQRYLRANGDMMVSLGEQLLRTVSPPRVLVVSTGAVYDARQPMPISETGRLGHGSPYAVSKVLVENLAEYYRGRGLDMLVARPFNHIGPGQGSGFLLPDLVESLELAVAAGAPVRTGPLETRRDYTDVRDVARAYRLLLTAEAANGVYNVASGVARSGSELLKAVCAVQGLRDVRVVTDPGLVRPDDPAEIRGDARRLQDLTGWRPNIDFLDSVRDYVRARALLG